MPLSTTSGQSFGGSGSVSREPVAVRNGGQRSGHEESRRSEVRSDLRLLLVGRGGVEPPTFHFSGGRSYQLSYLPKRAKLYNRRAARPESVQPTSAAAWRSAYAELSS